MLEEVWDYDYTFKLILAGDSNVGKTSFFNSIQKQPTLPIHTTIGVDYCTLKKYINNKYVKINIWDTAGQERYQSVITSYFKELSGVILIFNVNDKSSFKNLKTWMRQISHHNICDHPHPVLLIGNKTDKINVIDKEELDMFINEHDVVYNEISCLYDTNLEEVVELFIAKILSHPTISNCKGVRLSSDIVKSTDTSVKKGSALQKCCVMN